MNCVSCRVAGIGVVLCKEITPDPYLPGFFDLWTDDYNRKIINANCILEVFEQKK